MPFLDLHAHFPMHHEIPDDPWKKFQFDAANVAFNYENGEPRVSLKHWFDDHPSLGVTGLGSVLYDPQDDFFVKDPNQPIPKAICHIEEQLDRVVAEIQQDGRVQIARS